MTRTRLHRPPPLLNKLAAIALGIAAGAAAFIAFTGPGYRLGLWDYPVGFRMIVPGAYVAGVAGAFGLVCALIALARGHRKALVVSLLAFVVGASAAIVPWNVKHAASTTPPVNDVTTDVEDPPQFSAVLPLRTEKNAIPPSYSGESAARIQQKAYPDLKPVHLAMPPQQAFTKALGVAKDMKMTVVYSDAPGGIIEAYQRTFWYGFTDDVVIRIRPDGGGSRVDIRSKARLGHNDFGTNAERVRAFIARLRG